MLENATCGWLISSVVTSRVRARANVASTNPIARSNSPSSREYRKELPLKNTSAAPDGSKTRQSAEPARMEARSKSSERLVGVGEAAGVHLDAGANQRLDLIGHVPDVDVHARDHAPALEPEGDELATLDVA